MSRATPQLRRFAERLIAFDARGKESSGAKALAVFPVCETLRPHLATLMGTAGVRSLLSRALTVTREEMDGMNAVAVDDQGCLRVVNAPDVQAGPEQFAKAGVVLLAQLLGMLVAFIGAKLTLQLVREAWPTLKIDDSALEPKG
jgi:hypothetical protein